MKWSVEVSHGSIGSTRRWRGFRALIDELVTDRGFSLTIAEEADDVPVLLQLVRSGFGCTILDASFIPTLPPGIVALEIADSTATLDISLVWREDRSTPSNMRRKWSRWAREKFC